MRNVGLQIQRNQGGIINNQEYIKFNDLIKNESENISYNPLTGVIKILQPGSYFFNWWIGVVVGTPASIFTLVSVDGDYVMSNTPEVMGSVVGSTLVTVTQATSIVIKNISGRDVEYTSSNIRANLTILDMNAIKGEAGPQGATGEQGPVGEVGPQGPAGEPGINIAKNSIHLILEGEQYISPEYRFHFDRWFINGDRIGMMGDSTIVLYPNSVYLIRYTVTCYSEYSCMVGLRTNQVLIDGSVSCGNGLTSMSNGVIYTTGDEEEMLDLYHYSNNNIRTVNRGTSMQIIQIS